MRRMDPDVLERRRRRNAERPFRHHSHARLIELRAEAVRAGDADRVRSIDAELPMAAADSADDERPLESGMVFAL